MVLLLAAAVLVCALIAGAYLLNLFPAAPEQQAPSANLTVYYFYGSECPHCHNVTPRIESLRDKYPDVEFRILETFHDDTNRAMLNLLSHRAGRDKDTIAVPQVIVANTSLLGGDEIEAGLEKIILAQRGNLTGSRQVNALPVYGTAGGTNATIAGTYFYGNGCSHCDAVKPVIADVKARYPELRLTELEINDNRTNLETFLAMPLPEGSGDRAIPGIIIGKRALFGEAAVKDHLDEVVYEEQQRVAAAAVEKTIPAGPAATPAPVTPAASTGRINAVFFYSDVCPHCEKVKPVVADISARYPELNLSSLEVSHNAGNRDLFNEMCSWSGISNPGVPTIFIGNDCLVGEADITSGLEASVLTEKQRIAAGITTTPTPAGTTPQALALSPLMVIGAALVDSMNPCGLSVLVFLLLTMAAAVSRRRILLVGGTYIIAMFLFHLLVGIGLFSAFSLSGLAKPFSIIGGVIALLLGILTLADVFRNRETYLLSIPQSGKGMLGDYARKATLPAAFVLGVLAGILGFSCTGGIYISILGLMGRDMTMMTGLPWLVLYNLVFVLPLVLVTLLVAFGISPERAEKWRTENKRAVRVVIGLILVALGIIILSGWMG
ncbi:MULTISPECIES: cytochrome c biogenesis protein CcdA [unclassified Methanoregula]|uniref:cytochrome c biogenesis protein CcdA n=1 Tax=unclassified Methanoregula TaxID=2649730 RepID=UPI0009CDD403|nr:MULTISPECIES: cytochrome c biogenesis protein CcdA [unclassified Methanoregula]OPX63170.1 MAG: Cytochrome C biogenesis protein transmembrane region [Methanoregula sp. PtaB.Bin085]OPY33470.1 MAG: Cytochrome C biogenesis protein transmembrane region [Methanoregula sp. PtaU1.Bin006]